MGLAAIAAGAGVSALGSILGGNAQRDAARAAAEVERERLAEDKRRFEEFKPFRTAGIEAIKGVSDVLSGRTDPTAALEASPGFKFRLSQGERALDRFQSARGNRLGGAQLKEAMRFNQDFGSNEFQNFLDNRFRLAGAAGGIVPQGQSQLPQALMAGGEARANTFAGVNNAIQSGLQNFTTFRTSQDFLNCLPNPATTGATFSGGQLGLNSSLFGRVA